MVNLIDRVNPGYQKTVDAVYSNEKAETGKTTESAAQTPVNQDTYVPGNKQSEAASVDYKPNKALVEQLKAEQEANQLRFINMVRDAFLRQGIQPAGGDGIWAQIAQGNFTVDPETKAQAQSAIAEDGYWGVTQTSERLLNFAKALVGGDPSRAEEMRDAVIKGFEEAQKAWGGELPDISQQTYDATMKLFDDWAAEASAE